MITLGCALALRSGAIAVVISASLPSNNNHSVNKMNAERGLQAAVGIVLAFSILWTLAIMVPEDSYSSSSVASMQRFDGLVVDGKHYVLDTNTDQTNSAEGFKVIHAVRTQTTVKKSPRNIKRKLNHVVTSASTESAAESPSKGDSESNEETTKQPKMSSFSYAWFILFICYHARNFIKKKNRQVLRYGEEFFVKTSDNKLEYGLEYEDEDGYSVDSSFYGSISKWSELQKFDLDDDPFV